MIKEAKKEYYAANREKILAQKKEYRAANKDKIRANKKESYAANREKILAQKKEYQAANREKIRAKQIKYLYGITLAQYNEMYLKQLGLCAACHNPFGDKTPHIDHCHTTGEVRGLLHPNCNTLLGLAKDDAQVLLSCSEYLVLTPQE